MFRQTEVEKLAGACCQKTSNEYGDSPEPPVAAVTQSGLHCLYKFVLTRPLQFTWDERKNRANQRKHGISFETAVLVFDDPYHISTQDREVEGELRWQTIGMVNGQQILVVAHTTSEPHDEEVIRIISARKATPQERGIYAQGI